jgi:hypothetical protein
MLTGNRKDGGERRLGQGKRDWSARTLMFSCIFPPPLVHNFNTRKQCWTARPANSEGSILTLCQGSVTNGPSSLHGADPVA